MKLSLSLYYVWHIPDIMLVSQMTDWLKHQSRTFPIELTNSQLEEYNFCLNFLWKHADSSVLLNLLSCSYFQTVIYYYISVMSMNRMLQESVSNSDSVEYLWFLRKKFRGNFDGPTNLWIRTCFWEKWNALNVVQLFKEGLSMTIPDN